MRSIATLVLAVAAASLPAHAVYKWVDEKGVTQYTEEPPPEGRKGSKIEVRTTGPSGSKGTATEDWKQKDLDAKKERIQKTRAEENEKRRSDQAQEARNERCLEARRQIDILTRAQPIFKVNERGERVFLEDKDRPREIEEWREQAERYCR